MSSEETYNKNKIYRRHRIKSKNYKFQQNAKGFAKNGIYGRGTDIDNEQYNYFISILNCMRNSFEDMEEKVNMANNVFEQTKGKEVYLASNQIVCKALESLIGFVEAKQLENYFETFAESLRPICSDRYASFVLQKMVEIAFLRSISKGELNKDDNTKDIAENETEEPLTKKPKLEKNLLSDETFNLETIFTEEHKTNCGKFVLKVGKFMLNNLEDFVWDMSGSHIMRTCILSLSGVYVNRLPFDKEESIKKNRKTYEVSSEWHEVAKEFAVRLQMWPQFKDLPYQDHSSGVLVVLCIVLKEIDKKMLKNLGKKILMEALLESDENEDKKLNKIKISEERTDESQEPTESDQSEDISTKKEEIKLPKVFEYKSAVLLLEALLTLAGPKLLTQLYVMLFSNRIGVLAKNHRANYAVQKLLANIKKKKDFETIFQELEQHIEELLKIGFTGVITSLSSACLRLKTKQAQFVVALQKALHLTGKEHHKLFFLCILKLKPFEIFQNDKSNFVHLHGSLTIQDILRFNKPIFMVNCLLKTSPDQLTTIFNSPNGSHICEAFLQSEFVGEKSRDKLLKHLEGFYIDLAITKFGSRVVESCFASAGEAQKAKIVKELADKLNKLKASPFGNIINSNLRVETYCSSVQQWKASLQRKESKAQQLFQDIIN